MRHILSILMENEAGALSRVAGLFSARGYNVKSLTVAETEDPSLSRMTIVTVGTDKIIEQIIKQLNKLVDVIKLVDLTGGEHIERELLLLKVSVNSTTKIEIKHLVDIFHGKVTDVSASSYVIELTGSSSKLDAFINSINKGAILEVVRTGVSGIGRGENFLRI